MRQTKSAGAGPLPITAAAAIIMLDGFDAFSLSLMAPHISAEFNLDSATLGAILAAAMGGMIAGGFFGGAVADRFGRLKALLGAVLLFSLASLALMFATTNLEIMVNRVIAGVGLGAAAPIAIGLLSRASPTPPSKALISSVWACIAIGGIAAAAFNYFVTPSFGWRAIFLAGAVLPILAALLAALAFGARGVPARAEPSRGAPINALFSNGAAGATMISAAMFFTGYVTTAIINNWLPTILAHREASALAISLTFAGINLGGLIGAALLGALSDLTKSRWVLAGAWISVGLCGLAAGWAALDSGSLAGLAIAGSSLGVGAQSLSVAMASLLLRGRGLEATSVGFMTACGRIGQFSALSLISVLLGAGMEEHTMFLIAGISASVAGVLAYWVGRQPAPQ